MARTRGAARRLAVDAATLPTSLSQEPAEVSITTSLKGSLKHFSHGEGTQSSSKSTTQISSSSSTIMKRKRAQTTKAGAFKKSRSSGYADPSKYAHLSGIPDALGPNLLVVLVGHNPGVRTAQTGHAYSHPSNHFWRLLHQSGLTDRLCKAQEDQSMPELYSLGLTNIVSRPTKDTAELSKAEQAAGTPILEEKVRLHRPEVVCLVGKSNWEAVWRWRHNGKNPTKAEFKYGWQSKEHNIGRIGEYEEGGPWEGARAFVATTTSGLAATMKPDEKLAIWKPLGDWAIQRRAERASASALPLEAGDGDAAS